MIPENENAGQSNVTVDGKKFLLQIDFPENENAGQSNVTILSIVYIVYIYVHYCA